MRILFYLILLTLEISKAENDTLHMNDPLPQNETGVNGKERKNLMVPYDRPMIVLSTTSWPLELQETEQPMGNIKWKCKMPMPSYSTVNMKTTLPMPETTYNDGIDQQYMDNTKIYGMHDKRRKREPWKTKYLPDKKMTKQWYPNNDGMYTRYKGYTKMYTKPWKYSSTRGRITKLVMTKYPFTMATGQQYSDFTGTNMATNFQPDSSIHDYYSNYAIDDQYNYGSYDQYDNENYDQYNTDYNMYYQIPSTFQDYNYYDYPPYGIVSDPLIPKRRNKMFTYRDPRNLLPRGRVQLHYRGIVITILPTSEKRSLRDRRNKNLPLPLAFRSRGNKQMLYYPTEMPYELNTDSMYKTGRASDNQTVYEEYPVKTSLSFPTNVFPDYDFYGAFMETTKLLGKRDVTKMTDAKDKSLNYDY